MGCSIVSGSWKKDQRIRSKDRSLRQLLQRHCIHPVGAAEGCDPSISRLARMVIQRNNLGLANPVTVDLAQVLDRLLHAIARQTNVIDRDELVLVVDQLAVLLL